MDDNNAALDRAGRFSLGTTVIALYIFFVSAVFTGFATYIYRSEWQAMLALDNASSQDLDNLIFAIKREDTIRYRIREIDTELASAVQIDKSLEEERAESPYVQQTDFQGLVTEKNIAEQTILDLPFTADERSKGRARLEALSTNVWIVRDSFKRLVSFPTIFLTLIVTIAAGGLGTVVAFSRRYYEEGDDVSLARLFVNVGEGIAAAMAIFLFSGAGMLALTNGTGTASAVELSPYTVAFIAFLSGFMAEDAFASIQAAGKRIFKRDETVNDQGSAEEKLEVGPHKAAANDVAASPSNSAAG